MIPITDDLSVYELLQAHPSCIKVLIQYRTRCVGCVLDRFCTLHDVARYYELSLDELLGDLRQAAVMEN